MTVAPKPPRPPLHIETGPTQPVGTSWSEAFVLALIYTVAAISIGLLAISLTIAVFVSHAEWLALGLIGTVTGVAVYIHDHGQEQ